MAVGRSPSRRSLVASTLALATVATLLVSGRPAAAQYLNAYKAGLDAIEAKDWERAESSMSEALAERGEEKMKLPVKLFLRPYLPHFYLGYARFERGDCAGALRGMGRVGAAGRVVAPTRVRLRSPRAQDAVRSAIANRSRRRRVNRRSSRWRARRRRARLCSSDRTSRSRAGCGARAIPRRQARHARRSRASGAGAPAPRRRRRRPDGDQARRGVDPPGGPVVRRGRQRARSARRGDAARAAGEGPGHRRARRRGEGGVGRAPPTSLPTREPCARRERTSRGWWPKQDGAMRRRRPISTGSRRGSRARSKRSPS